MRAALFEKLDKSVDSHDIPVGVRHLMLSDIGTCSVFEKPGQITGGLQCNDRRYWRLRHTHLSR